MKKIQNWAEFNNHEQINENLISWIKSKFSKSKSKSKPVDPDSEINQEHVKLCKELIEKLRRSDPSIIENVIKFNISENSNKVTAYFPVDQDLDEKEFMTFYIDKQRKNY